MIKDVIVYVWMLVFVASAVLIVIGILRWLADLEKRKKRLNIVFGCAFVLFVIMFLVANWKTVSKVFSKWLGSSAEATMTLIDTSKITIKVSLMVLIVAFAVLMMLIVALFVMYGLWAMICTICSFGNGDENDDENDKVSLKKRLQDKAERLIIMLNTPVFILIITGGILAVFGIIPIVMGAGSDSLAECWQNGVKEIARICNNDKECGFVESLSMYLLVYVSVLGIGYAVVNILFEIIKERFGRKNKKSFLTEYSNSFGILAVGVSVLLMFSFGGLDFDEDSSLIEYVVGLVKPFALVLFVIALGVLTLGIVRLLVDIKEQLIFREARYLFLMLVGQCTVIIIKAFSLIYNAFGSALAGNEAGEGSAEEYIGDMKEEIIGHIALDIDDEINEISKNTNGTKIPYITFKKRVTKK